MSLDTLDYPSVDMKDITEMKDVRDTDISDSLEKDNDIVDPFEGMSDKQIIEDQQKRVKNYINSERYNKILSNEFYFDKLFHKSKSDSSILKQEMPKYFEGYPGNTIIDRSLGQISYKDGDELLVCANDSLMRAIFDELGSSGDYLSKFKSFDEIVGYKTFISKLAKDIDSKQLTLSDKKSLLLAEITKILDIYKEMLIQSDQVDKLIDQAGLLDASSLGIQERSGKLDNGYELLDVESDSNAAFHVGEGATDPYLNEQNSLNMGEMTALFNKTNNILTPGKVYLGKNWSSVNIFAPVYVFMSQSVDGSGLLYEGTKHILSEGVFDKNAFMNLFDKNDTNETSFSYRNDLRQVYAKIGTLKYVLHKFDIVDVYKEKISSNHILLLMNKIKHMPEGRTKKSLENLLSDIQYLFASPIKKNENEINLNVDWEKGAKLLNSVADVNTTNSLNTNA